MITDLILKLAISLIVSDLPDQLGAERWDYDGQVAQVSLFFTEDREIKPEDIKKLEYTMEAKMREYGLVSDEEVTESESSKKVEVVNTIDIGHENTKTEPESPISHLYNSCYSAQGISTLVFDGRRAEDVDTIGVEGDFLFFHPLELVSGSYFMADDVMKDKVVIDEQLAWELFGSSDIVGQCITIGGVNHYIAGVVKIPEGNLNEAAGLGKSIVYMSYDSLSRYGEILSGKTESVELSEDGSTATIGGINCYEVVMPNPVEGIAAKIVAEASTYEDRYITVVDNTDRYSFFKLWDVSFSFGKRSMWDKPIFYPYWENVARGYEDILSLLNFIRTVCICILVCIITVAVVNAYRNKTWTARGIINYLADKKYEFEANRHLKLSEKNKEA